MCVPTQCRQQHPHNENVQNQAESNIGLNRFSLVSISIAASLSFPRGILLSPSSSPIAAANDPMCRQICIQQIRISRSYWARKARHGTPHSLFLGFGPWPWCRLKKEDWQPKKERNQRTPGRRRSQEDQLTPASSYSGPGSRLAL